jgi:hypothetical protein
MNRMSSPQSLSERRALLGGVGYAAVQFVAMAFIVTMIFSRKPGVDAALADHYAFYLHYARLLDVGNYLLTLTVPFFLVFLGGIYGAVRRAEGGEGVMAMVVAASGTALIMTWPLGIIISGLGGSIAHFGGDAATVWALDGMAPLSLALSALPRAVFLAASCALLRQANAVPGWVTTLGFGVAAASAVTSATLTVPGLFPFLAISTLLFEGWVLAVSVSLLRQTRPVRECSVLGAALVPGRP